MSVEVRDERFRVVVGDQINLERLGTGFSFTEGPIWHHNENHLTFSDIPGNAMQRWHSDGKIEVFRKSSNMANGNAYDGHRRIVTCEHGLSRVTRTEVDGEIVVLASHYDGKELNSPNDVVVKRDGRIFFTDPIYGRMAYYGIARDQQLEFQGVYAVKPDGSDLQLLAKDFSQPNGLCFSLDEKYLFVNDTDRGHIRRFDVSADGCISGGDVWVELSGEGDGAPDGLKIDSESNVYCCGPGGVHVFAPDKTCLGVIKMPEVAANFTWGDADMKSIFFTASTSLYRCRTKTPGPILF